MNNVVATIIKFLVTGQEKAAAAISSVQTAAKTATKGISTLAMSLGSLGGSLGKAAGQVANFLWSVQQMGAIGGIIAGAQMLITKLCDHFVEQAQKVVEAAERMGEHVHAQLDKLNKERMDGVLKALKAATTEARDAAAAFDALASSYLKVQQAEGATASSGASAALSSLTLEKAQKMADAKDDGARSLVGAGYDVRISEEKAKTIRAEQDRAVKAAADEAEIRARQSKDARKTESLALKAMEKAQAVYAEDVNIGLRDKSVTAQKLKMKEDAEKAYADAVNNRIRSEATATEAAERVIQAENARREAINEATRGIIEARDAEKRLIEAQKKAAQAELDRLSAEKKVTKSVESGDGEKRAILEQISSASSTRFSNAFNLWRDPAAAQQAQDSAKARTDDLKRFQKSVDRYGGKWRIDEAAELMRNGDEAGLQDRLAEWRKSSKFNGQTEQMVLAAAAKQNENAAEKSLAAIQKTSDEINAKLAAIKEAFEGSGE